MGVLCDELMFFFLNNETIIEGCEILKENTLSQKGLKTVETPSER